MFEYKNQDKKRGGADCSVTAPLAEGRHSDLYRRSVALPLLTLRSLELCPGELHPVEDGYVQD
jgi:hypothetical protein